ncbi:MAG TPA: trypsin-like peptidase domain-containing protein [Trebonia sp.]|jgi:putative serine protease PepD
MERERSRRMPWWPWILIPAFAVVGVGGGFIGAAIASPNSTTATASTGNIAAGSAAACSVTSVADNVLPAVVTIAVTGPAGAGTGSGEVIRDDGYILTNNHVIAAAAEGGKAEVTFAAGATVPATIVGRDVLTDLAVLKVSLPKNAKVIAMGSSSSLRVGQPVVVLGAPLGLSGTVTSGIVSALDRTVEVPAEEDRNALLVSAVQTDAAINPGNSGGAMVNCSGQLVGVPSAGATVPSPSGESSGGSIGLGFAIPVDLAKTISNEIIDTGRVTHAFFGLQTVPIPPAVAAEAGISEGLFVAGVVANGPSEQAGLRQGDIITKVDGNAATSNVQLQELTITKNPGDKVSVDYTRDGRSGSTTVTLGTQS